MERKYRYREKLRIIASFLLLAIMFFYATLKVDKTGIRIVTIFFFAIGFFAAIALIIKRIKTREKSWLVLRETELELPIELEWGVTWIIKYSDIVKIEKFSIGISIVVETGEIQEQFDDEITTLQYHTILRKMMKNRKQFDKVFEELQLLTKRQTVNSIDNHAEN